MASGLAPVAATRPPGPMDTTASQVLVDEAQRQLRELHADASIPDPAVAYFADWVQDPYGAAYHFWQVGARSWEVMPRMRNPLPDANLYVCGSAWSTGQGWTLSQSRITRPSAAQSACEAPGRRPWFRGSRGQGRGGSGAALLALRSARWHTEFAAQHAQAVVGA
jgi:Flavin containing amine oxidoreductase